MVENTTTISQIDGWLIRLQEAKERLAKNQEEIDWLQQQLAYSILGN